MPSSGCRGFWSVEIRVAAAALGLLLASLASGDLIPTRDGFGYDGFVYATWVQSLSVDEFTRNGKLPIGVRVNSYRASRVLPSLALHYAFRATGKEPTTENVITAFRALNLLMITLGVYWWCRAANELAVGDGGMWLGGIALVVSYMNLKMPLYYPTLTDSTAFGVGALMLLLYMRGRTGWLIPLVLAGAFIWPTFPFFGALLIAFPRSESETSTSGSAWLPNACAAVIALAAVGYTIYLLISGYEIKATPVEVMWIVSPLSVAIVGLYLFFAMRPLLQSPVCGATSTPRR